MVALACAAVVIGCEQPSNLPELGEVTGVVTLDGRPLASADVMFFPNYAAKRSQAITDENGRYELLYQRDIVKGAVVGHHTVAINKVVEDPRMGHRQILSDRYWKDSTIRREVKAGKNVINLALTSDPSLDSE
ncbi:MAG: hypothetical protein CMJ64_16620 [Planctomycetaceae bacterium]|nr:hypothetical protein [Planctomycetaceae bacterium]